MYLPLEKKIAQDIGMGIGWAFEGSVK